MKWKTIFHKRPIPLKINQIKPAVKAVEWSSLKHNVTT
jgi:hypothetical protein